MTDVPELPPEQIQQRVVALWLGSFYGSSGYVGKRLGRKGLREFQDLGAHQVADTFKKLNLTEPGDLALAVATNDKNLFGSDVTVNDGDGWAEIRRDKCALKEGVKAFGRLGATGLLAKQHCKTCVESHWRKVFSDLGMDLVVETTDDGCIMKISKK
ncbi:MAG: hypothetical protein ACXQT4_06595 [Methanotrichaceae archaeon]